MRLSEFDQPQHYRTALILAALKAGAEGPLSDADIDALADRAVQFRPSLAETREAVRAAIEEPIRWEDANQDIAEQLFDAARTGMPLVIVDGNRRTLLAPVFSTGQTSGASAPQTPAASIEACLDTLLGDVFDTQLAAAFRGDPDGTAAICVTARRDDWDPQVMEQQLRRVADDLDGARDGFGGNRLRDWVLSSAESPAGWLHSRIFR